MHCMLRMQRDKYEINAENEPTSNYADVNIAKIFNALNC